LFVYLFINITFDKDLFDKEDECGSGCQVF